MNTELKSISTNYVKIVKSNFTHVWAVDSTITGPGDVLIVCGLFSTSPRVYGGATFATTAGRSGSADLAHTSRYNSHCSRRHLSFVWNYREGRIRSVVYERLSWLLRVALFSFPIRPHVSHRPLCARIERTVFRQVRRSAGCRSWRNACWTCTPSTSWSSREAVSWRSSPRSCGRRSSGAWACPLP